MAKYKAKADLIVDQNLIKSGTVFESDHVPGKNWEPVDIGARAKVRARFPETAVEPAPAEPDAEPSPVKKAGAKAIKAVKSAVATKPKAEPEPPAEQPPDDQAHPFPTPQKPL